MTFFPLQVFEPDTLSIGSVDNPGIVQEEDEDLDDFSHIENNQDADKESSDIDPETSQTNHNNMINNEQNEEESGSSKEKTRQESKEDDTAEVTSPVRILFFFVFFLRYFDMNPTYIHVSY